MKQSIKRTCKGHVPLIVALILGFAPSWVSAGIEVQGTYESSAKKYHYGLLNTSDSETYSVNFFKVDSHSSPSSIGQPSTDWSSSYLSGERKVRWDYQKDGVETVTIGPKESISGFFYVSDDPPGIVAWEITLEDGSKVTGYTMGGIPVELTSFMAMQTDGQVLLTWTTWSETENLGFYLYRSTEKEANYSRLTPNMIPGAGNTSETHHYSYVDQNITAGETYYYKLADVDFKGKARFHGPISITARLVPQAYRLEQNFPNPFNPETTICFTLKKRGKVTLRIYNLMGQFVRILLDEEKEAGVYSVLWNAKNDYGITVATGVYYYTLEVNGFKDTKTLVFEK